MNAPLPPDNLLVARAPLDHFGPSATNRTHDPAYINTVLAPSLVPDGVLQPISARPWPNEARPGIKARPNPAGHLYEIIIGEGRWLASRAAKFDTIPFFWRDIDDRTALRMQLVENLKRKDLTEIEEAEGYRRLMKDHGLTADQVAQEIGVEGKSRSYVYGRLKLLDLCPAALKIARLHKLEASLLLLAARIPDEKLQIAAIKEMAPSYAGADPMSYRNAKSMVQRRYMLKLAEAPFSRTDAELLPAAGSCERCPKRTGNAADLFADVDSTDMCTDPGCHTAKTEAHIKRQRAAAKAAGVKVIEGEAAKKIKPNSYNDDLAGGFIDLDRKMYSDSKNRTVRQILGKDAPAVEALLIDPHHAGHVIEVVSAATIKEKLAAKGAAVPTEVARRGKSDAEKEAERKRKQEGIYRQRLFDSTRGAIAVSFDTRDDDSVLDMREFRQVAEILYHCLQFEDQKRLARLWIGPTDKTDDHELVRQLKKRIEAMERKDCARLMLEATLVGEIVPGYGNHAPEKLLATADALDIDAAVIKRNVIAEMREKAKPAKAKATPKVKSAAAKVQPETALPADDPLAIGDRVRVNDNATAPLGAKFIGKQGEITGLVGKAFMVTFKPGSGVKTNTASYVRAELDKLPPLGAKPAPTPSNAAQAQAKGATPAAPAKAQSPAKKPAAKKAKADPAPAKPANEAATPPKAPALNPVQAWPFPTGARP
jgi:ParB/RepB/Spo0J family partition protein